MSNKYSRLDGISGLGFLLNAMDQRDGRTRDGDRGSSFPRSDAEDLSCGCRFIPGEVTMARRRGERVEFHSKCGMNCWYWQFRDGSRVYHYDPYTYSRIAQANGRVPVEGEYGPKYPDGVGPCPSCGNVNTNGGSVKQ